MGRTVWTSAVTPELVIVSPARWDVESAAVWLRGEHDHSTISALSQVIARAIAHDGADLTLDLSEVSFIDAATIGIIVRTREFLRLQLRALVLRSPSRCAERLLDLCCRADLIEPFQIEDSGGPVNVPTLATWVAVPATDQSEQLLQVSSSIPSSTPEPEPAALDPAKQTVA